MEKAKRIKIGHYIYRGFKVECCGYIKGHMNWEAVDEHGCGFAHAYTLKGTKSLIDWELDERCKNG